MSWWKKILENTGRLLPSQIEKLPYTGDRVFEPVPGLHENVVVVDVASLYPTIAINCNTSPETVNRDCCSNEPEARAKQEVLQEINEDLLRRKEDRKTKRLLDLSTYKRCIFRITTRI